MWIFLLLGWGGRVGRGRVSTGRGASRRPLLRRTTLAWPSSTRGFLEFTCRPRRWRRRMRLLLVVVASPRGSSVRVDRSSVALGRGLFPTRAFLVFLPVSRRRRRICKACGFWCFCKNHKSGLVRPIARFLGSRRAKQLGRCRCISRTRAKQDRDSPLHHRSRNRCAHAAQELRTRRGKSDATQQWMRQESRCPSSPSAD